MGLRDVLISKKDAAEKLSSKLDEVLKDVEKLENSQRESLPKFKGQFEEAKINSYLDELCKAAKCPIRFRRRQALSELKIGVERVREEVFDDDSVEETINMLTELSEQARLYGTVSKRVSSLLFQESFSSINRRLSTIKKELPILKQNFEGIEGEDIKGYLIEQYVTESIDILGIQDISSKIIKIEDALNLTPNKDEFPLVEEVCNLLEDIGTFGEKFGETCENLTQANERLKKFGEQLGEELKQIKNEINYWRQLEEIYIPETKDINQLKGKLREIESRCKESFKSFQCLEQIYSNNLHEDIALKELAAKLEAIFPYFEDLNLNSKEDIKRVEEVYDCKAKLDEIKYENIEELLKDISFAEIESFVEKTRQIREEYKTLKKDCDVYQRILEIDEELPVAYPELKIKVEKYKEELITRIGKDFETLIKFLRDETSVLNVDKRTLENFIKQSKPFIREGLKL